MGTPPPATWQFGEAAWPFDDPKNFAAFTVRRIVSEGRPILHVCHDSADGAWQFLEWESPAMEDAMIVCLQEIVRLDPSIAELADLPRGWHATRQHRSEPWRREPNPDDEDDAADAHV